MAIPTVTPAAPKQGVTAGGSVSASSLFGATDPDGDPITAYQFWDGTGSGFFQFSITPNPPNTSVQVSAANLGQMSYAGAGSVGSEVVYVRAQAGGEFSAWQSWTMYTLAAAGSAPILTAPDFKNSAQDAWSRLSDIVNVSEPDGEAIWRFEIKDNNAAAGSGYVWFNGVSYTAGGTIAVEASDLANVWLRGGSNLGTDAIEVRAFDGANWSAWESFDLRTRLPDRAPVVTPTAATQGVVMGNSVLASGLFSVTDADLDTPTLYEFWDNSAGGGAWRLNTTAQAASTAIQVTAANLGTVNYAAGAGTGSETVYVRAYDGELWSAWQSWTMQTLRATNAASVVDAPNKNALVNEYQALSTFVKVTDSDLDPIVRFQIRDLTSTAGSGLIYANGALQAQGADVTVEGGNLAGAWVRGGANLGTDNMEIRVFDGYEWSAWDAFDLRTRVPNRAPVLTPTAATQGVVTGNSVLASGLFGYSDADADPATLYEFWDNSAGGGAWRLNTTAQPASTAIQVTAANLGTVNYVAGAGTGGETVYARAYDGELWSAWQSWTMQTLRATNAKSVVTADNRNALVNEYQALSTLVHVTDSDSDPIVRFEIRDNTGTAGSGLIYANGALQAQGADVTVEGGNLAGAWVRGGANLGTDNMEIRVFDGYEWSDWDAFDLRTRVPNRAPTVTPTAATQGVVVGNSVLASSLFAYGDADSDPATLYEFWDNSAGGGAWRLNTTAQPASTAIQVSAANLGTVNYVAGGGTGSETVYARAYDGELWSGWTSWTMQTLRGSNQKSTINSPATKNSEQSQYQTLSSIFQVSDADLDPVVRFEIRDNTGTAGSGLIYANGALQAQGADVTVEGGNLANAWVRGGADNGTNSFDFRVFDGYEWSDWKGLDLVTRLPNRAPTVVPTQATQGVVVGNNVAASTLFSVTDADGDTPTLYEFWDNSAGGGAWRLNTTAQPASTAIQVTAANLGTVNYVAGGIAGSETVYARAFDGEAWSGWTAWTMQTLRGTNAKSVITAPTTKNAVANQYFALSSFTTVTDADADPIVRFEIRDNTSTVGSGTIYANGADRAQGTDITVEGGNLGGAYVRGGADNGTDNFDFRVFDGYEWSDWKNFDLVTRLPNRVPTITAPSIKYFPAGTNVQLSGMFNVTDLDGDPVTYELWDGSSSAHLYVNGVQQTPRTIIPMSAAQFAQTVYTASGNALDNVQIRAHDGTGYSAWTTVQMYNFEGFTEGRGTPNNDLNLSAGDRGITFGIGGDDILNDPVSGDVALMGGQGNDTYNKFFGGDTVIYENGDSPNDTLHMKLLGGAVGAFLIEDRHLVLVDITPNGSSIFGASVLIDWKVSANRIENFQFEAVFGGSLFFTYNDMLGLAAGKPIVGWDEVDEDPVLWHGAIPYYAARELELRANQPPTLRAINVGDVQRNVAGYTLGIRFQATDPDQEAIVSYEFTDLANGGGTLAYNGVAQTAGVPLVVSADNLGLVTYNSSATLTNDIVQVRAFAGALWSAPFALDMSPVNATPSFEFHSLQVREFAERPIGGFFTVHDDGDVITQYEFVDFTAGHGTLRVNGIDQPADTSVIVNAADLATVTYLAGPGGFAQGDTLSFRANDGTAWGSFYTVNVSNVANSLPVVSFFGSSFVLRYAATPEGANGRISPNPGGPVFVASDPDGDPIVSYQITDNGLGGGYLEVNGVVQAEQTPITLTPQQLANTYYVAGSADGNESISLSASDGTGFGTAQSVGMFSVANIRPTVSGANTSGFVGMDWALGNRFSYANNDEGIGKISQYEIRLPDAFAYVGSSVQFTAGDPKIYRANIASFDGAQFSTDGAAGGDYQVSLRVSDSIDWSEWSDITVHLLPEGAGNSTDTARQVTLGSTPQTFNDWLGYFDDSLDYYHFTLDNPANVSLQLDGITSVNTVQAMLTGDNGVPVGGTPIYPFTDVGSGGLSTNMALASGSYYLRLVAPAFQETFYNLTVSAS